MTEILQPGINVAIVTTVSEVENEDQKVLFVGQKTAAGSATGGDLQTNILNDGSWDTLFGDNSMLAEMIRNARLINEASRFDAIGLDDSGTTKAVVEISIEGGNATADSAITISLGSERNHSVTAAIPDTSTPTATALAIKTAIDTDVTMPFIATVAAEVVILTAVNAGTYGNTLAVAIDGFVDGQSIFIEQTTAGAIDPTLTAVLDVIGEERYQTIVWPYPDDLNPLLVVLDARFNATGVIQDGVGVTADLGDSSTLGAKFNAFNSQSLVAVGDETTSLVFPDLVSNGGFADATDWTVAVNWAIAGLEASHTAGAVGELSQIIALGLKPSTSYLLTFTVTAFTSGTVTATVGGTPGTAQNATGTFTELFTTTTGDVLEFVTGAADILSIDDVSLFEFPQLQTFLNKPSIFEIPAVVASEFSAIRSVRLTSGTNIAQFLSGQAGLDAIAGPALASRPYFNTPLALLPLAATGSGYSQAEVEDLFDDGVTVLGNNSAANSVILGETVTTYKTDSAGNPDTSFKFLNFVDTASNVREYISNNLRARFSQSRLTEGDLVPGRPMANSALILSTLVEFYTTLSGPDFALTQLGEAALTTFISNTTVSIDLATGTATVFMGSVPLVTQLRQINAVLTISFSTNG